MYTYAINCWFKFTTTKSMCKVVESSCNILRFIMKSKITPAFFQLVIYSLNILCLFLRTFSILYDLVSLSQAPFSLSLNFVELLVAFSVLCHIHLAIVFMFVDVSLFPFYSKRFSQTFIDLYNLSQN